MRLNLPSLKCPSNTSWCVTRPCNAMDRPLTWIGSPNSPTSTHPFGLTYNGLYVWLLQKSSLMKNELIQWYHALGDSLGPYKVFLSLHTRYIPLLYETLQLIYVHLHLQYSNKKCSFYIHLVDLPIHSHSYSANAFNCHKFGHGSKGLVEIHYGPLEKILCY